MVAMAASPYTDKDWLVRSKTCVLCTVNGAGGDAGGGATALLVDDDDPVIAHGDGAKGDTYDEDDDVELAATVAVV